MQHYLYNNAIFSLSWTSEYFAPQTQWFKYKGEKNLINKYADLCIFWGCSMAVFSLFTLLGIQTDKSKLFVLFCLC